MDIEATSQILGNIGEFVGAIAVVATLAYLAVQVRHNKEATEAVANDTATPPTATETPGQVAAETPAPNAPLVGVTSED